MRALPFHVLRLINETVSITCRIVIIYVSEDIRYFECNEPTYTVIT